MKFHPIPQMPFLKPLGRRVYSIFASLFSFMKDNSVFFQLKPDILWKIHQILHVIFETTSQFLQLTFASLFNVKRYNCSVLYWLKLNMILTKGAHQSAKISGKFQLLRLISPNLYLVRLSFFENIYNFSQKKVQRSYAS